MLKRSDSHCMTLLGRQDGIAMLTVLMLTVILTVIGIAAITSTTMDIRMAGGERMRDTSVTAAEACLNSGVQIIQKTIANGAIPASLLVAGANPVITTPLATVLPTPPGQNPLQMEIMGQDNGDPDNADPTVAGNAPNARLTVPGFIVNMDIDRLYKKPSSGKSLIAGSGYEGTGTAAMVEIHYRINCFSANPSGSSQGLVSGVYACLTTGESCQRKL